MYVYVCVHVMYVCVRVCCCPLLRVCVCFASGVRAQSNTNGSLQQLHGELTGRLAELTSVETQEDYLLELKVRPQHSRQFFPPFLCFVARDNGLRMNDCLFVWFVRCVLFLAFFFFVSFIALDFPVGP